MWAMIHVLRDEPLLAALREEALSAVTTDEVTGQRVLDTRKLVNLPLMQSVYVEAMRLHTSFNPMRKAAKPLNIQGYNIEKGALVQTCSRIAHLEEEVWATGGHPASEFWGWRHVKTVEEVDERTGETVPRQRFTMAGRPSSFFPYGVFPYPLHLKLYIANRDLFRRRPRHVSRSSLCKTRNHHFHRYHHHEFRYRIR